MLISSENGGGEIVSTVDDTRFYDDIHCLAADWGDRRARRDSSPDGASAAVRAYVRLAGGAWSDADAASYAEPDSARTAMGSGIVAFATDAEARAADRAGRALTFDEVLRLIESERGVER